MKFSIVLCFLFGMFSGAWLYNKYSPNIPEDRTFENHVLNEIPNMINVLGLSDSYLESNKNIIKIKNLRGYDTHAYIKRRPQEEVEYLLFSTPKVWRKNERSMFANIMRFKNNHLFKYIAFRNDSPGNIDITLLLNSASLEDNGFFIIFEWPEGKSHHGE